MSCTNPKTSTPIKTNSDTAIVVNIENNVDSSYSDTTIIAHIGNDTNFSFLINERSQPYMTVCINMNGEIMAYWGDVKHRRTIHPLSFNDLKQSFLERFETEGRPKENEAIHVEIDVSTPKKAISALKETMSKLGINHCELVGIHNYKAQILPPPPQAIRQAEAINAMGNNAEIEESTIIIVEDQSECVEISSDASEGRVYNVVENQPSFPGGMVELMRYLQKNIKYPTICLEQGIQGRVVVQFVVNKDGSICEANVLKHVDPQLDAEALRVIRAMPHWIPGKQKGECVRVRFTIPVPFRLPEENGKSLR